MQLATCAKCLRRWFEVSFIVLSRSGEVLSSEAEYTSNSSFRSSQFTSIRKSLRALMARCVGGSYFAYIGDAFGMWKSHVAEMEKLSLVGDVDTLKGMITSQASRIAELEANMVKYESLKKEYICHKVVVLWTNLFQGLLRDGETRARR